MLPEAIVRTWTQLVAIVILSSGCTHVALEHRTINQASTLTDLQYQQVLDNLAMFTGNPDTLPWHLRLKSGLVQIADTRGAVIGGVAGGTGDNANSIGPSVNAQRVNVGQWDVDPVVDDDDLDTLRLVYVMAVERRADEIEKIKKEIRRQIWKLLVTYDFAAGAQVLLDIMLDGLEDGFEESLTTPLKNLSESAHAATPPIGAAKTHLDRAKDALKEAVEMQRFEIKKADRRESDPRFASQLVEFKRSLIAANLALDSAWAQTITEESKRDLKRIQGRIAFMADFDPIGATTTESDMPEENLRLIVAHLNPVISRDLETRKEKKNCGGPYKPRFEGPFDPQVDFLAYVGARKYLMPQVRGKVQDRNPGLADQAKNKVDTLRDLLYETQTPWFCLGSKKDVPGCACYVAHYCGCGRDCYVWVMPDQLQRLREFTLKVLSLASSEHQDVTVLGAGAAFSPGSH
jgi:hypothetical protein